MLEGDAILFTFSQEKKEHQKKLTQNQNYYVYLKPTDSFKPIKIKRINYINIESH